MEELIYHGTTLENAKQILSTKHFIYHKRLNHWLGNGIYFFVNDFDAAKWWSTTGINSGKNGAVLEYDLILNKNQILDLDTLEGRNQFTKFYEELEQLGIQIKLSKLEQDYLKKHPKERSLLIRSKILELFYGMNTTIKCCVRSFETKLSDISPLVLETREKQLVIIDATIIDISKLKLKN